MSFLRMSKFKHVFAERIEKHKLFSSVKIYEGTREDGSVSSVNAKFLAVCVAKAGGGGSFIILSLDKPGKVDLNHPKICGHKGPVLDLQWNPFDDNEIASASEDCEIKLWTIPDGGITKDYEAKDAKTVLSGHEGKVNRLAWHPCASNILASSGVDRVINIWNTELAEILFTLNDFGDNIFCFSWSYNGKYICATSKDKKLRIFDVRKQDTTAETESHPGTGPSHCVFLGARNQILTTGFSKLRERQYRLWNTSYLSKEPIVSEEIDNGWGVLMPFWDEGTNTLYLVGKGDSNIRFYEIIDEEPYMVYLNTMETGMNQKGVCAMPRHCLDYLKCEIMRFYLLRHSELVIEPLSMIVPRKSELFQEDIFKTCAAPKPALTASEWISGVDKDPLLLKYTKDGLVDPNGQIYIQSQATSFKTKEAPKEITHHKMSRSLKPLGAPSYATLDDYKALKEEIEKLKKDIAELKAR